MFNNALTSGRPLTTLLLNTFNLSEVVTMDLRLLEYVLYLAASVVLTFWVGRTLHSSGRRFLVDVMEDDSLADSVNHLLLVGFYLVNLGIDALLINAAGALQSPADLVQTAATQLGIVLLVLGVLHFGNLYVLHRLRRSGQAEAYARWYQAHAAAQSGQGAGAQ
jgi:hypothetical protein